MNTPETNLQREFRQQAEARARLRAELDRNPLQAAMAKAMQPTKAERAEMEAAHATVTEAERAVEAIAQSLDRAQMAKAPSPSGFAFFQTNRDSHRAAAAAVSIPSLQVDLAEARGTLQAAIRRRNVVAAAIDAARFDRRAEAKRKHAPKPTKPTMHKIRTSYLSDRKAGA